MQETQNLKQYVMSIISISVTVTFYERKCNVFVKADSLFQLFRKLLFAYSETSGANAK